MNPVKTKTVSTPSSAEKVPNKQAIIRAVASSTAIETGQSIRHIERTLLSDDSRFGHIALAN